MLFAVKTPYISLGFSRDNLLKRQDFCLWRSFPWLYIREVYVWSLLGLKELLFPKHSLKLSLRFKKIPINYKVHFIKLKEFSKIISTNRAKIKLLFFTSLYKYDKAVQQNRATLKIKSVPQWSSLSNNDNKDMQKSLQMFPVNKFLVTIFYIVLGQE